jgi:hypothetical protein
LSTRSAVTFYPVGGVVINNTKRSQWPYVITVLIVWTLMLGTLAISASHIIETAQKLGLHDWQAYTTPALVLVDVIAVVDKLGRLDRFAEATRRSSFKLMVFGGALSLACNVYAGNNHGERAYGVLLVAAFLLLENHATKLKLAPADHPVPHAPAAAPTSPGMPPLTVEASEALAYRQAAAELRRTSRVAGMNGKV